ncbi:hypothetical protein [Anaerosalibacter massiliensis]|uniref:Uncharacterized protein n=1 Tax=Anaerosalibacter massiliensis TaxID=1347392 RepID=A0A9X2S6S6_9FIRM|nr:hypothetical protein [Anaerosalibacter massiliensis]MCR2043967.1 hypothetical protein [Anaerosalibacter massiliensis]
MNINEKFIINLQGKNFITYEGLLDLAHKKNLKSIDVDLIQIPTVENNMTAICKATAITDNEKFSDIGDASPQSVNSNIAPHLIRMASTRAKARVLRDLNNIGMTSFEEVSLDEDKEENKNIPSDNIYEEPPTERQLNTIKRLSDELNFVIPYENLTKRTAGTLISRMLNEKNKKH